MPTPATTVTTTNQDVTIDTEATGLVTLHVADITITINPEEGSIDIDGDITHGDDLTVCVAGHPSHNS